MRRKRDNWSSNCNSSSTERSKHQAPFQVLKADWTWGTTHPNAHWERSLNCIYSFALKWVTCICSLIMGFPEVLEWVTQFAERGEKALQKRLSLFCCYNTVLFANVLWGYCQTVETRKHISWFRSGQNLCQVRILFSTENLSLVRL